MRLHEELTACGCKMDEEAFRQIVAFGFDELFPGWTDEQLLKIPDEAKRFCSIVRQRCKAPKMADSVILGTVMNLRKRSRLKIAK